ncbi:patatin-like phospholipase family protein [Pseudoflavonifractor phocaeensis]|uniref:patatin-like phospholipase family protein n=1 Tax=Pseudoflavonifractor phocaeensis TaxID=1870988 RepID=UPI001F450600|nr:patatin family protein [Pseudoflavonifractor phocaeensis]MCF2596157.1 patatin family protein [Pseudoflavonifractor phocaeensis]
MKTGIVLEGGALRAIFSSGVCDGLLEGNIMPDYLIGVSAGIAYGVSYLSRQPRRNLEVVTTYASDHRYMGMNNLADKSNRSYFGLKFAYDTIPNELIPFDYDAFAAYPGQVEAVVTNLNTGKADYMEVPRLDRNSQLLQATCAMPLMFPIYHLNGQPYLDGGIADSIPWRRAMDQGCDRVMVVMTHPRDYVRKQERLMPLIRKTYREYPNFVAAMEDRAQRYNEDREQIFDLERQGKLLVIAPDSTMGVSRTERNPEKLRLLWAKGYQAAMDRMEEIRAFFSR